MESESSEIQIMFENLRNPEDQKIESNEERKTRILY